MTQRTSVFLASSKELSAERLAVEQFIARRNKLWQPDGIFLHLDVLEDFDDAMSATRKQDDYNAAIEKADIFVLLVHTKVGKYSREEFESAWTWFQRNGRPKILTYFKSPPEPGDPDPGPEYHTVRVLQDRLAELKHWPNQFDDENGLLLHFGAQFDKWRKAGFIKPAGQTGNAHPTFTATVTGPGAIAQGDGAQAAGAGGVVIGGHNTGPINTGRQTITHGGTHVRGNVTVSNGDFVGGNKTVHGLDGRDLAALFEPIRQVVAQSAPSPDDASLARVNLDALQAEVAKPADKRSDKLIQRLLDGLVDLVPDAVGAVLAAFGSPLLAGIAGPATKALLQRLGGR